MKVNQDGPSQDSSSIENMIFSPPREIGQSAFRQVWKFVVVFVVFCGSVVAFVGDGGMGNIDSLLGQYGVTRVKISSSILSSATGYLQGRSAGKDFYDVDDEWNPAPVFELLSEEDLLKGSRNISRLPRTISTPYNEFKTDMSEQYFLYSPSGGWSNQRMCLLSAIGVCRDYNLTLLVPPAARHSNFEDGYLDQTVETTIPMDQVLDLPYMSKAFGINIVPLNGTLFEFWKKYLGGKHENTELVTYPRWPGKLMLANGKVIQNVRKQIQQAKTPIIFAKGRWYSRKFYPEWYNAYVRYSPYFQSISQKVAAAMNRDFDAFHIRLGDYEERALKRRSDCKDMVSTAMTLGMNPDRPVYIATDGEVRDNMGELTPYFKPMKAFKRVVSQIDLAEIPEVAEALIDFKNRLPTTKIYMDTFGMIEQLIATRSRVFVGTSVSTFSRTIMHMRHYLMTTVPDLTEKGTAVTWNTGSSYLSGWSGRIASRGHTQHLDEPVPELEWGPKSPEALPDRFIAVKSHVTAAKDKKKARQEARKKRREAGKNN